MDLAHWLPWMWGGGAVLCGVLLCCVHPWKHQFRLARTIWRKNRWLWMAPVVLAGAEPLWQWQVVVPASRDLLAGAGLAAGDTLAAVLTSILHGDVLAMVLAAAFVANSGGLRRGLWKGIDAVFSGPWRRVLQLTLIASATATLGIPMVRFGAGGETGRLIVKLMAAVWISTAAALLMCRLMLAFESGCRTQGRVTKLPSLEVTGQFAVRWWLPILAGAAVFPVMEFASADIRSVLRAYAWPVAALMAWFPLTALLRAADAGQIHSVMGLALRRWAGGLVPFCGWLVVAGVWFFGLFTAGAWLSSLCPAGAWGQAALVVVIDLIAAWLSVWTLGAWVAIQTEKTAVGTKDARGGGNAL